MKVGKFEKVTENTKNSEFLADNFAKKPKIGKLIKRRLPSEKWTKIARRIDMINLLCLPYSVHYFLFKISFKKKNISLYSMLIMLRLKISLWFEK